MTRALGMVVLVVAMVACDGVYRVVVPHCPVSDSAKAAADSIPFPCLFPDSARDSTGGRP